MDNQFHIHEYNALRNEFIEKSRQIGELDKFLLASVAVTLVWLISQSGKLDAMTSFVGAWIPFFLTLWFSSLKKDIAEAIYRIADYVIKLEECYASENLGWERTVRKIDGEYKKVFNRSKRIYMFVQLFTLIFAIYYVVRYSFGIDTLPFLNL